MKTTMTKKSVYEANYISKNGMNFHTDYIISDSRILAKQYADDQLKPFNLDLISFQQVPAKEARQSNDSSIVEI